MEKYDVSVIIPCYNCEDTISRCIDSVINQTLGFNNIELILVDDKSKDNTGKIIGVYSDKYSNIKAIFLDENSGYPGRPRNIGIKQSTADYIMFLDSDDEYDSEICEKFTNEIIEENADLVSCSYVNNDSNNSYFCETSYRNGKKLENKILIENDDVNYFKMGTVWCNIFKKSIIIDNNITFPEDKLYEDAYFMIKFLLNANKVVYLNNYYGYLRNLHGDSTMHSMSIEQYNGYIDVLEESLDLFPEDYDLSYRFNSTILWFFPHFLINNPISIGSDEYYAFLKRIKQFNNKVNTNKKLFTPFNIINWFAMRGKLGISLLKFLYIYIYIKMAFSLNYTINY